MSTFIGMGVNKVSTEKVVDISKLEAEKNELLTKVKDLTEKVETLTDENKSLTSEKNKLEKQVKDLNKKSEKKSSTPEIEEEKTE